MDDMIGGPQRERFKVASHHLVQPILPPAARRIVAIVKDGVAVPGILKIEDDLAAEAPLPQSAQHEAGEYRGREEHGIVTRLPQQSVSGNIQRQQAAIAERAEAEAAAFHLVPGGNADHADVRRQGLREQGIFGAI